MKRLILFLIALFCFFLISVGVQAAEGPIDLSSASSDVSGDGWSWHASTRLLSLSGTSVTAASSPAILLPSNSTLSFSGTCSVSSSSSSAIACSGLLTVRSEGSGKLTVTGGEYGVRGPDTVLITEGITLNGTQGAVSGFVDADNGVSLMVSRGGGYVSEEYDHHSSVTTSARYPVYVSVSRGGGASFYAGMFAAGEKVSVSAQPYYGYALSLWSSGDVEVKDPEATTCSFTMPAGAVRISGQFERVYSVTVDVPEGGHVEVITPGKYFVPGREVILYAVADTGYYFSHWTSDYGRFRDPLQAYGAITVPHVNVTAKPVFVKGESYYLKVGTLGEGETNISIGNFPQNKSVLLRATPAEGYVFSGWLSDTGHFLSSMDAETYFVMPGSNAVVTAVFSLQDEYKKTLTVEQRTGGKVNVTGGLYVPGMPVTLAAEAKTGYRFAGWEIEPEVYAGAFVDPDGPKTEFVMPEEDVLIRARFELTDPDAVTFYLSVAAGEGGTVTSEGSGNYLAGYEFNLSAAPAQGYYFAGWESAMGGRFDNSVDANTVFYMPANDTRVTARFEKIVLPVEEDPTGGGTTPIDGADLKDGAEKNYLSFGISLLCCSALAAGGTLYTDACRKAAGERPLRFSRRRKPKNPRPRRKL